MYKIIIIAFLFTYNIQGQNDKKYVSTFGLKIEIIKDVQNSNPHTLYAITNHEQKNILLGSIFNFIVKDSTGSNPLFNLFFTLINNTDFNTHICYVLLSKLTNDIEIHQPFHYNDGRELFFELRNIQYQSQQYVYTRIYKVKIEEDKFEIFILDDEQKTKMIPVKL